MKRFVLPVLFFFITSFAAPQRVHANPALAIIAVGLVGATVLAIGGTQYALGNSTNPYSASGPSLARQMWAYNKLYQAGQQALLGLAFPGLVDIAKAVKTGALNARNLLSSLYDQYMDQFDLELSPLTGTVYDGSFMGCPIISNRRLLSTIGYGFNAMMYNAVPPSIICDLSGDVIIPSNLRRTDYPNGSFSYQYDYTRYFMVTTNLPTTQGTPVPWDDSKAPGLSQALAAGAAANPAIASQLDDMIKEQPDLLTGLPEAITPSDVEQYADGAAAAAQQAYIDQLKALVAANPANAELQAQLDKALAEQAQQNADDIADNANDGTTDDGTADDPEEDTPDETFPKVADTGSFDTPYNPGEFDIPARFTTFLDNVQSSALFSFSDRFFNSLPGGGSPVYEINAGRYGHHTVDMSQTMTSGLAILKTILLACFGFLSIRAVIMKR